MNYKLILLLFLIFFQMSMSELQNNDTEIHSLGIGRIRLNSNVRELDELTVLTTDEIKMYAFYPSRNSYKSLRISNDRNVGMPFIIKNVFAAFDSTMMIKKIVTFVQGQSGDIVKFLDDRFQKRHNTGTSYMNGTQQRHYFIWQTEDSASISLVDFSDIYGDSVVVIQFFNESGAALRYSVLKIPASMNKPQ